MNELLIKIFKVILTLIMFSADKEDLTMIKFDIFISVIYAEAVRDSI